MIDLGSQEMLWLRNVESSQRSGDFVSQHAGSGEDLEQLWLFFFLLGFSALHAEAVLVQKVPELGHSWAAASRLRGEATIRGARERMEPCLLKCKMRRARSQSNKSLIRH